MAQIKTQGTELYFVDNTTTSVGVVAKLTCPTGITGITAGASTQIDATCLDTVDDMEYVSGLGNPGTVTVPFILDPQAASHQALFDLKQSKDRIDWIACLSEGDDVPVLDTNGDFVAPSDRTSIAFIAYVADLDIDISTNEIVRGTLTLQRSGGYTFTPKAS